MSENFTAYAGGPSDDEQHEQLTARDIAERGDTEQRDERPRFTPGYEPTEATRIHRRRLHDDGHGVAEVTFDGMIGDATECWVAAGRRVPSLYAEVVANDAVETTVRVALVPTGKRVPLAHDGQMQGFRLGSERVAGRTVHVYLLGVHADPRGTAAARRVAEQAARDAQVLLEQSGFREAVAAVTGGQVDDGLSGADAHLDDLGD